MEALILEGAEESPHIVLDPENNKFDFSGKSFPEDVAEFYNPVLEWLDNYLESPNKETVINCKFEYFNTASSKVILDIMLKFEEMVEAGHTVKVNWHFNEDDEDMEEAGEEYADMVNVPFKFFPFHLEDD